MMQLNFNKETDNRQVTIVPIRRSVSGRDPVDHLALKDQNGYDIIPFDDVLRCQADGNYTSVYTTSGHHFKTCKTLKEIANRLPETGFSRIHQSHVVALSEIRRVDVQQYVCLSNGEKIPYSRRLKGKMLVSLGIK